MGSGVKCMSCSHQSVFYDVKHHDQDSVIEVSPESFAMVDSRYEKSWYLDSAIKVVVGNFHNKYLCCAGRTA